MPTLARPERPYSMESIANIEEITKQIHTLLTISKSLTPRTGFLAPAMTFYLTCMYIFF